MKLKQTETQLQSQCIDLLLNIEKNKPLWFTRLNTAPSVQKTPYGIKFRKMGKGAKTGIADLLIFFNYHTFWVELKSATGVQSDSQIEFQKAVDDFSGSQYFIIRDLDSFKKFLIAIGVR